MSDYITAIMIILGFAVGLGIGSPLISRFLDGKPNKNEVSKS